MKFDSKIISLRKVVKGHTEEFKLAEDSSDLWGVCLNEQAFLVNHFAQLPFFHFPAPFDGATASQHFFATSSCAGRE